MFAQRNLIRRLAARVLLVWLFALATGVVNACSVTHGPYPASMPAGGVAAAAGDKAGAHAPGCPGCEDEEAGDGHPPGCAKFCAEEASSVPSAKHAFDAQPVLGIALVPTMALAVAVPVRGLAAHGDGVPLSLPRVPARVAYLRLTL
jgi:hypothetical protein